MNGLLTPQDRLTFAEGEILQHLAGYGQYHGTGYWQHSFDRLAERGKSFNWFLGVHQQHIIYSSSAPIAASGLLKTILRYTPPAQRDGAKPYWRQLQLESQQQTISEWELIRRIESLQLLKLEQINQAIKLKILNDLDSYQSLGSGNSTFVPQASLEQCPPILRCRTSEIAALATQRRHDWKKLYQDIPSLKLIPVMGTEGWGQTNFNRLQQSRIESLLQGQNSLQQIAQSMGKDSLAVGQMFAKLVRAGVVELQSPHSDCPSILIVDDSPIILTQFERWLTDLGYPCLPCQYATQAMKSIQRHRPSLIFLDINMPVISGFELVKQIRMVPELAQLPIVILTGEQKLSNKWRAQWSGCEFLTKPTSTEERRAFMGVLQELIPRLIASPAVAEAPS
jgi:CheY-like chemotaxis protein